LTIVVNCFKILICLPAGKYRPPGGGNK